MMDATVERVWSVTPQGEIIRMISVNCYAERVEGELSIECRLANDDPAPIGRRVSFLSYQTQLTVGVWSEIEFSYE